MSKYRQLAQNGVVVAAYEVFFVDDQAAEVCKQKYRGEMTTLDDGFLVKIPIERASDDDPIVKAIKKAIADARLEGLLPN